MYEEAMKQLADGAKGAETPPWFRMFNKNWAWVVMHPDHPTRDPRIDAWFKAYTFGKEPGEYKIRRRTCGVQILIDKPEHLPIIEGMKPTVGEWNTVTDIAADKTYVVCLHDGWPWEDMPYILGFGTPWLVKEAEPLPLVTSSEIIRRIGGNP